jgi:hypothetical protein
MDCAFNPGVYFSDMDASQLIKQIPCLMSTFVCTPSDDTVNKFPLEIETSLLCSTRSRDKHPPLLQPPTSPITRHPTLLIPDPIIRIQSKCPLPQLPREVIERHNHIICGLEQSDDVLLSRYRAIIAVLDHLYINKINPSSTDITAYINARKLIILKTVATMQNRISARKKH